MGLENIIWYFWLQLLVQQKLLKTISSVFCQQW